ncbi:MAG TPA: cadherin-like domain-containing protein [Acidimicrobiia bacterium]|nr:cadherin-like domain-containing protein [Acidimicrobiia bacterium]
MRRFLCGTARRGRRVGLALSVALLAGLTGVATPPPAKAATSTSGYWLVGTDGGIFSYGQAKFLGSTGAMKLNQPIVGMTSTPDGKGYWMVASDGGIFSYGTAGFYGSMGGKPLNQPIVGIAATRTGKGYWMVASDGGIFSFGDAGFFGSTGSIKLNKPIVDIAPTPSGRGYWMAASDGGIFSFGDAAFYGSTGAIKLAKRIQQMAATPSGKGYWLVAGDGGIFSFGDAAFYGSAVEGGTEKRIVDIAPSATGKGYYITASNGAVYAYGDAKFYGGAEGQKLAHGIIAMVPINNGEPPLASNDAVTIDEDGTVVIDVLANDRDPDGGVLSLLSVAPPLHGTATVVDGQISYKPTFNYSGSDTFSYTVIDSNGLTAIGLVSVTIRPLDDLPKAIEDAKTVVIGQTVTIDVLGNDGGLGDGLLDLSILPPLPTKGTATKSADGRAIVYTPTKKGSDVIRYRIVDLDGDNAEAAVRITVEGAAPKAIDIGPVDCSASACNVDVLASGASLGASGQLTMVDETGNGIKTIDGGTFYRQGSVLSFIATRGNVGQVEVRYRIADEVESSTGTVTFRYQNSVPAAQGADISLPVGGQHQLVATDVDSDVLQFWYDGAVEPGVTASIDPATGILTFSGAPGPGTYTIKYHVTDPSGAQSEVAEVRITTA